VKSRRNPKRIAAIQAKNTEKYSLMKGTESIYRGKNKLEDLSNYAIRHGLRGLLFAILRA